MSFSEDVRHELVERPPAKSCCRLAFLSGRIPRKMYATASSPLEGVIGT